MSLLYSSSQDEDEDFGYYFDDYQPAHESASASESSSSWTLADEDDADALWDDVFDAERQAVPDEPRPVDEVVQTEKAWPRRSRASARRISERPVFIYKPERRTRRLIFDNHARRSRATQGPSEPVVEEKEILVVEVPAVEVPLVEVPVVEDQMEQVADAPVAETQPKARASRRTLQPAVPVMPVMPVDPVEQSQAPQILVLQTPAPQKPAQGLAQEHVATEQPKQAPAADPAPIEATSEQRGSARKQKKKPLAPQREKNANGACGSHIDCGRTQYCNVFSRRCTNKLALRTEGCLEHVECAGEMVACVKQPGGGAMRSCVQACRLLGTSFGCREDETCVPPELGQLKGFNAEAAGLCVATAGLRRSGQKAALVGNMHSSSYASAGAISGLVFGAIALFFCARAMLRRRYRKQDRDAFLFAGDAADSMALGHGGKGRRGSGIDQRLGTMGGAKFTHWAPMQQPGSDD